MYRKQQASMQLSMTVAWLVAVKVTPPWFSSGSVQFTLQSLLSLAVQAYFRFRFAFYLMLLRPSARVSDGHVVSLHCWANNHQQHICNLSNHSARSPRSLTFAIKQREATRIPRNVDMSAGKFDAKAFWPTMHSHQLVLKDADSPHINAIYFMLFSFQIRLEKI